MGDFDITDPKYKPLRAFTMHGAALHSLSGTQAVGDCPFCSREGHFFVNWEKLLWDCKVCGEKGNRQTFLDKVLERNKKEITKAHRESLAEDRGLPTQALDWVELGFYKGQYTIAVRGYDGKLEDIRVYKIGSKAMSTAGSKAGIFGLKEMLADKTVPVWICEGEWDTVAMQWLLSASRQPGRAVCSPGAGTFKPDWAEFFLRRNVTVAYDHDPAGLKGELIVLDRLARKAKTMQFVHWPTGNPSGYDLRDFITKKGVIRKTPKTCYKLLTGLVKAKPRSEVVGATAEVALHQKELEIDPSVGLEDVFKAYEDLLHEPNRMGIELTVITMLAATYKTDRIWAFLVAPPSSGKTAILNGLKYLSIPNDDRALFVSHITTHSLISGMETKRGDPSIFAQLNGTATALVIKDFTGVLAMRSQDKEDVYGQFRDGYDGYTSKTFGNGIKREYNELKFNCIAAVTEAIYDESANFQALGERFCKLNIGRGNDLEYGRAAIVKSMVQRDDFLANEDNAARLMYSCVKNLIRRAEDTGCRLPRLNAELQKAITGISLYVAAMRGVVSRDKYRRDYIKSAPSADMGIRNAKMLCAIAAVRAAMYGRDEATLEDLPLIRKIALDTINQRDEEILREIYLSGKESADGTVKSLISEKSRYTPYTVRCVMEDLLMLDILRKKKEGRYHSYQVSPRMLQIIEEARLYRDPSEENRENPKVRLRRSKAGEGKFSSEKQIKMRIKKRTK